MRVVLDTNIVVSGLLWRAAPRQVLDAARDKRITLHTSSVLLDELAEVLSRPHLASVIDANRTSPEFLMQRYAMLAQLVIPAQTARVVPDDIDDDALAFAAYIKRGIAKFANLVKHAAAKVD